MSDLKDSSINFVKKVLQHMPTDWLTLTTHRLDIYNEPEAKTQFLNQLLVNRDSEFGASDLKNLPTAFDYIRLGHQLSCLLEWLLAEINNVPADQAIVFSSRIMPLMAVMRKNALEKKKTYLYYETETSPITHSHLIEEVYEYKVVCSRITNRGAIPKHDDGSVILVTQTPFQNPVGVSQHVDVSVNLHAKYGCTLIVHNSERLSQIEIKKLVGDIQHVRRRETVAMTPVNCLQVLNEMVGKKSESSRPPTVEDMQKIFDSVKLNSGSAIKPLIASSGLSVQYAILMGLIHQQTTLHPGKPLRIVLPVNCYGGTNDQARRIAASLKNVEILDLHVDGDGDLNSSLNNVLDVVAKIDGVPIVLTEIPTNPRVEVPNMEELGKILRLNRKSPSGSTATKPIFIVDQTFCPNMPLLHAKSALAGVETVSFVSGSKFPSGGRCTAGYTTTNELGKNSMSFMEQHLILCDNTALPHQLLTLAEQMPSMPERIKLAYKNAREFVNHIKSVLPAAKINFVSDALAEQGFTPSVFSLDLPTFGDTASAREKNKRDLNLKLISYLIEEHPLDCKYCVSYGQLKGCYWTIPATSTQGTTQENDKDYIVRVALPPEINMNMIKSSFTKFFTSEKNA